MRRIILRVLNGPILVLFAAIGIAIQSSLFTSWPLNYFQPDIVLLTIIWCGLRRNFEEGGIITLVLAELCEIHSATPQGLFLISYMAVFLLVRAASRFFVIPSLFSYVMLTIISSVTWKLVGLMVLYLLGASENQWRHTFTLMFIGAGVEGAISVWVYRWIEKFDWITFKHTRAEHAIDDDLQLDSEEGY